MARQSQNDYLREFLPRRSAYLDKLMELEGMDNEMHCDHCQMKGIFWRCMDCVGGCFSCTECLRINHKRLPFHRVESWDGDCFRPAWLYQAGVRIYLGHNGEHCPLAENQVDDDFEFDSNTPWV